MAEDIFWTAAILWKHFGSAGHEKYDGWFEREWALVKGRGCCWTAPVPAHFMVSPTFTGAKAGYTFKMGPRGLGYYGSDGSGFIASASFTGVKPGYVFAEIGPEGIGYYDSSAAHDSEQLRGVMCCV